MCLRVAYKWYVYALQVRVPGVQAVRQAGLWRVEAVEHFGVREVEVLHAEVRREVPAERPHRHERVPGAVGREGGGTATTGGQTERSRVGMSTPIIMYQVC